MISSLMSGQRSVREPSSLREKELIPSADVTNDAAVHRGDVHPPVLGRALRHRAATDEQ